MRMAPAPFRRHNDNRRPVFASLILALVLSWSLVAGGLATVMSAAAQDDEPFATAAVAPADALAYMVVPLHQESDQWTQALVLLERAGLGSVLEQISDDALSDGSDESMLLELFLGGELAVVVTDTAAQLVIDETLASATLGEGAPDTFSDVTESGFALAMTADSSNFIAVAVRAAISDTADEVGGEAQEIDHEGITITYVEVPAGSDQTPLAMARVDDFVFVAGFPVDLEPLIETSQGSREPLTSVEEFEQVQAALDEEHLAFGYVNPFPSDELRAALGEAGLPVGYIEGRSAASGFLIVADEAGFRFETVAIGAAGAGPATEFTGADLLARTPDDALVFMGGTDLAGTGVLDAIGALLLTLSGLAAPDAEAQSLEEQLDAQFAALAQNFGVNLRTELLQQLTGEFGLWVGLDESDSPISALFASGVDEPATVAGALAQLTLIIQSGGSGELTVVTRPVGDDSRVFVIDTSDPTVPRVEYGVVDEQLVIGLGDGADNVDQPPVPSLADAERFQTIMSVLPEPASGLAYVDLAQAIPLLGTAAAEADVEGLTEELEEMAEPAVAEPGAIVPAGDAHPDCAAYASQEEAQTAYDAFAAGTFRLDQDFDGEACDDFFGGATPVAATPPPAATPVAAVTDDRMELPPAALSAFTAFGLVAFEEEGNSRTSSLLLIADAED